MADRRILVVDDDESVRFMLRLILEGAGYQVTEAHNGITAQVRLSDLPPDMLVTDMIMPGMNGQELIRWVRSNPPTATLPVLVVTGHPEARDAAVEADAILGKPFDRSDLLATVLSLWSSRREDSDRG